MAVGKSDLLMQKWAKALDHSDAGGTKKLLLGHAAKALQRARACDTKEALVAFAYVAAELHNLSSEFTHLVDTLGGYAGDEDHDLDKYRSPESSWDPGEVDLSAVAKATVVALAADMEEIMKKGCGLR